MLTAAHLWDACSSSKSQVNGSDVYQCTDNCGSVAEHDDATDYALVDMDSDQTISGKIKMDNSTKWGIVGHYTKDGINQLLTETPQRAS